MGTQAQNYSFREYSLNDGLPQATIYCMMQDSRGYLWLGTDGGGLCRFDGKTFQSYKVEDGLSGNVIRSLLEDKQGNIWIGTDKGLTQYNGSEFIRNFEDYGFKGSNVLSVFETSTGHIFAGTNDAGLNVLSREQDSLIIEHYDVASGLISNFVFDMAEDNHQQLWLAMAGGITVAGFAGDSIVFQKLSGGYDVPGNLFTSIAKSPQGDMWAGTYQNGAVRIQGTENVETCKPQKISNFLPKTVWQIYTDSRGRMWFATDKNGLWYTKNGDDFNYFNTDNGLNNNQVLSVLEDHTRNIWIGTMNNGLVYFQGPHFLHYRLDKTQEEQPVYHVMRDHKNALWLSTDEKLLKVKTGNKQLQIIKTIDASNGLKANRVNTSDLDKNGTIWVGTDKGIFKIRNDQISSFSLENKIFTNNVNAILCDSKNNVWAGTNNGYLKIDGDRVFSLNEDEGLINNEVQTIIEDKSGNIWMGTLGGLVRLKDTLYQDYNAEDGLAHLKVQALAEESSGNIWIGTFGGGLYYFDKKADSLPIRFRLDNSQLGSNNIYGLSFFNDTLLIVATDKGFDEVYFTKNGQVSKVIPFSYKDGFQGGQNNLNALLSSGNNVWFGTISGITQYRKNLFTDYQFDIPAYISNIKLFFKDIDWEKRGIKTSKWFQLPQNLKLNYNENHLTFDLSAIQLHSPDQISYRYMLEGQANIWSPLITSSDIVFSSLKPGDYKLKIEAFDKFGNKSQFEPFHFEIQPPFWQTVWFWLLVTIVVAVVVIIYIRYRERKLRAEKIKLERIVNERTKEIRQQKTEIEKQRDQIQLQNNLVTAQNKEITDSIHYAERIQKAVMPYYDFLDKTLADHFIMLHPKDIVSGDFFWMTQKDELVIVAAADCTGHGVPGAFMSMLGVSFLNRIVNELGITQPDEILNELREGIMHSLKQQIGEGKSKDGMDIALCVIDPQTRKLQFAGANNPAYIIRKNGDEPELIEVKADRMPVAIHIKMNPFQLQEVQLQPNDSIYTFSDGYIDQFGGPKNRKFMKKRFKQLLMELNEKAMAEQQQILAKTIGNWMDHEDESGKKQEQIDDILVIGLKV